MLKGKGLYIWQIEKCGSNNANTLAQRAKDAGLEHIIIKVADGENLFPIDDPTGSKEALTAASIQAFREAGISVWGWSFIYGTNPDPVKQAQRFIQRLAFFKLDGAVINAEKLSNNPWSVANARKFRDTFINTIERIGIPKSNIALSSYRYPSFHPDFPFDTFMQFCSIAMPQVYWVSPSGGDPVRELLGSFDEYNQDYPTKVFLPTGAAYGEQIGNGDQGYFWQSRPDQITTFLNQTVAMDLPAANFWSWQHAWENRPLWEAIAAHPFKKVAPRVATVSAHPFVVGASDTTDDDGVAEIAPDQPGYREGVYTNGRLNIFEREGKKFTWSEGRTDRSTAYAQWLPRIGITGEYLIEAYIPGINATARRARYHITGVVGQAANMVVELNQLNFSDEWARLGFFELDGKHPMSGMVSMTNLVGAESNPAPQVCFGPLRWRRVERNALAGFADGFDSPVGTADERREPNEKWGPTKTHWNGAWVDANPYLNYYFLGYHTGVDLNLPGDADRGAPAYAIADGTVTYSGEIFNRDGSPSGFGTLVIIRHDPYLSSERQQIVAYSRYGHMKDLLVKKGQRVKRGDKVGTIWNRGTQAHHLHFDISLTGVLETAPGHWPGEKRDDVLKHYVDPYIFIRANRPQE